MYPKKGVREWDRKNDHRKCYINIRNCNITATSTDMVKNICHLNPMFFLLFFFFLWIFKIICFVALGNTVVIYINILSNNFSVSLNVCDRLMFTDRHKRRLFPLNFVAYMMLLIRHQHSTNYFVWYHQSSKYVDVHSITPMNHIHVSNLVVCERQQTLYTISRLTAHNQLFLFLSH